LWSDLLVKRDLADPRIRISYALYELSHFRDVQTNVYELEGILKSPPDELRPVLEAAGFILGARDAPKAVTQSMPPSPPKPQAEKESLFTWLHLSDIHIGHKDISHSWDQALVLDALRRDIAEQISRGIPAPDAILVTGDISFSGTAEQYKTARTWLLDLAKLLKLDETHLFLVPGNHDVNRSVDKTSRNAARLLRGLRDDSDSLDEALANAEDRALLTLRMAPYLAFAATFPSIRTPDPFFCSHPLTVREGLRLHLIGLNTALLAANELDKGKLRLGKEALARTLTALPEGELVLVLTHHPFRDGWLADQREADSWIKGRAHVHLFGHVHEADAEEARAGAGTSLLRIAAGAVHGDRLPEGVPASHGYSFAAVVPAEDGTLRLRVWPRRWSEKKKTFTQDTDNTPQDRPYAEHTLPGLRLAARATPAESP
jgi:calcineurin-like phosphoesterase family protein